MRRDALDQRGEWDPRWGGWPQGERISPRRGTSEGRHRGPDAGVKAVLEEDGRPLVIRTVREKKVVAPRAAPNSHVLNSGLLLVQLVPPKPRGSNPGSAVY